MKLRRSLLVALTTLPLFAVSAFANPVAQAKEFRPAMKYLGPEMPAINIVAPASVPTPAASEGIGPGSPLLLTRTDGSVGCTANFIWKSTKTTTTTTTKGKGKGKGSAKKSTTTTTTETKYYLGAAGHCFLPGGATPTDESDDKNSTAGPDADYDPRLTSTFVCVSNCTFGGETGFLLTGDFVQLGQVAYARQSRNGQDIGQDFGIVEIPAEALPLIRPSMPVWGGPTGLEEVSVGRSLCLYGNAAGFGEVFPTKARAGVGTGISDDQTYWKAELPSFEGDSGSAIVTCDAGPDGVNGAGAAGLLTHIAAGTSLLVGIVGTTTGQAVRMALDDTALNLQLVLADGTAASPTPTPPPPPPPPPPPTPPADGTIGLGQEYSWNAGPFTRVATTEQVDGESCDNRQDEGDTCDYEYVQVNVPTGGGTLSVNVTSDDPTADFDLYVFGPDGTEFDHSANPANPEEISKVATAPGIYTIAVNAFTVVGASYTGTAKLDPPPPPPPPEPPAPTLQGDGHIYQFGALDPFVLTEIAAPGAVSTTVVPGSFVDLSVRSLHSNDPNVKLSIDANGLANFTAVHQITKDGQLVFGPFNATPSTDDPTFQTTSTWDVPADAPAGTYVFEAYVTVGGQTYKVAELTFDILG